MTEHIVVYQISMKNGGTSSAWIDTDEVTYNSAKLYDEYKCRVLYTSQQPARQPLTDEEIHQLMPAADGSAEDDVVRVEVSPGLWGKEYTEVDAWSRPLVIQIARSIEAAHGIKGEKK